MKAEGKQGVVLGVMVLVLAGCGGGRGRWHEG
jgi:hypothetical protein